MDPALDLLKHTDAFQLLFSQVNQTQTYWNFWLVAAGALAGVLFAESGARLRFHHQLGLLFIWTVFAISNHAGLESNLERRTLLADRLLSGLNANCCGESASPEAEIVCAARPEEKNLGFQVIVSVVAGAAIFLVPRLHRSMAPDGE